MGRADLLTDEDGVLRVVLGRRCARLEMDEDAPAQVADVLAALAQVGVVHLFEPLHVFLDRCTQRSGCPVVGPHPGERTAEQALAVEHERIGVEQGVFLRWQHVLHACAQRLDLCAHGGEGIAQGRLLACRVLGWAVRYRLQFGGRIDRRRGPDPDPR